MNARARASSLVESSVALSMASELLYFAKQPVTVTTSETVYEDMAITNLNIKKSTEVGYAREIPI